MSSAARRILEEARSLCEDERLELATELIATVDGVDEGTPPDWEQAWMEEIDRRVAAARERGERGSEWAAV